MMCKIVEPFREHELIFRLIPEEQLTIPKIQREVSEPHIKKLTDSIIKLGFIEPITVIPNEEDENIYEIINGQHRFLAGKKAGIKEFPAIILPKQLKEYIIFLNIEKAPTIKDKAHQAKEIFNKYLNENPDKSEDDLEMFIEKAYLITLGIIIEDLGDIKFPASIFERFLDKFDSEFLTISLSESYKERINRGKKLLEVKKVLNQRYMELGLTNPYLKSAIISKAMTMEYGRAKKIEDNFYDAIEKLINNIKKVVIGNNDLTELE